MKPGDLRHALRWLRAAQTAPGVARVSRLQGDALPDAVRSGLLSLRESGRLGMVPDEEGYTYTFNPERLRPSWDEMGMETAQLWAARSVDPRHQVGAAILSDRTHTLVAVGFNGRYAGSLSESRVSDEPGKSGFVHAEVNAILNANWQPDEMHALYCTHEPCPDCALVILAVMKRHRLTRLIYSNSYVAADGRHGGVILSDAGIGVLQW